MDGHKEAGAGQLAAAIGDIPVSSLSVEQFARALAIHAALVNPKGGQGGLLEQAETDARRILAFIASGTRHGVMMSHFTHRAGSEPKDATDSGHSAKAGA